MGNLRRRPNYMLINSLVAGDVSYADGILTIKDYGQIDPEMIVHGYKCCYCPGTLKQVLLNIKPKYPCNECDGAEFGFSIFKKYELTGQPQVPSNFYGLGKYYGWRTDNPIDSTTNYLDPLDIEEGVANIVNAIGNIMPNAQAIVDAYERIRYTYNAGTITLIVKAVGSSYTHTYTGATVAALRTAIIADATRKVHVVNWSAQHITLEGNSGFGFTCTITNLARDDDHYWIRIKQYNIEKQFDIRDLAGTGTEILLVDYKKHKVHPKDVARVFPIMPLSHVGMQPDLPIKNGEYCVYYMYIIHTPTYSLDGANHVDAYYEEVYFYVLRSVAESALWDTILSAAGVFDQFDVSGSSGCSCDSDSYSVSISHSVSESSLTEEETEEEQDRQ